ncbi:MAG: hypothetical protein WBR18_14855 [Anaerolineales bacterium]
MYDDLRNMSDDENYFEDPEIYEEDIPQTPIFGMTAGQRLLISILLLATVIVMGVMALLVTAKVWIF